jgi:hypothetical protein
LYEKVDRGEEAATSSKGKKKNKRDLQVLMVLEKS